MMLFLPLDTWIRLLVWMLIGFDLYLFYGLKNSRLSDHQPDTHSRGIRIVSRCGLFLVALLAVVAIIHHYTATEPDWGLYIFSLVFAAVHLVLFLLRMNKR
jgi:APA family basic amino acid/polyamine antiporter